MTDWIASLLPILTALLAAAGVWVAQRPLRARLERENHDLRAGSDRLEQELRDLRSHLESAREESGRFERRADTAEAKLHLTENAMREQQEEIRQTRERMRMEFQNLAGTLLEEKSARFAELNRENMDRILGPLGERIESFRKKVEEVHASENRERVRLQGQITEMMRLNQRITEETRDLTRALKSDSRQQGHWGEVVLKRILEFSGLREGHEFRIQHSHRGAEGNLLRPDVEILLPDERFLIIDSKVSLTAYERSVSSEEPAQRERGLKEHLGSLRQHIAGLKSRSYEKIHGESSPDFVLMFIPVEPAYSLALQHDPELYREAFEHRIILVSPTTLMATLATIETLWRQERQNRSAMEIANRGGLLLDKLHLFLESMEQIGTHLRRAGQSYDQAVNRLQTGQGNLLWQAEQLRELGVKPSKEAPAAFRAAAGEEGVLGESTGDRT